MSNLPSFFRYPGGKAKLRKLICEHLSLYADRIDYEYREPFFGGGSIGLKFITDVEQWKKIWINDKDAGVASIWTALIRYPDDLKQMVRDFTPSVEAFDNYKKQLTTIESIPKEKKGIVELGFKKIAIHQISYSGLGTKSGGPLGGRDQKSEYKIDCRWSPDYICRKIDKIHNRLSSLEIRNQCCTGLDFMDLITDEQHAILYLDPPYYVKGNDLYQCGFTTEDHERLSESLKQIQHPWVLSYDDCEDIRQLYKWACMESMKVNYSITGTKNKKTKKRESRTKPELLIYPYHHQELLSKKRKEKEDEKMQELPQVQGYSQAAL